MLSLMRPTEAALADYLESCAEREFSYATPGMVQNLGPDEPVPEGWTVDINRRELVSDPEAFERAREALDRFAMFDMPWIELCRRSGPLAVGTNVATLTWHFGLWALNPCRVIDVIDEPERYGFLYGTLDGHLVCGEERFLVERDKEGGVSLEIQAWSRPATWLSRSMRPYLRYLQGCFGREAPSHFAAAIESNVMAESA